MSNKQPSRRVRRYAARTLSQNQLRGLADKQRCLDRIMREAKAADKRAARNRAAASEKASAAATQPLTRNQKQSMKFRAGLPVIVLNPIKLMRAQHDSWLARKADKLERKKTLPKHERDLLALECIESARSRVSKTNTGNFRVAGV